VNRKWYVHATPIPGYIPSEDGVRIDLLTGNANRMVNGPFNDPYAAAAFVDRNRPMQAWLAVAIISNREKVKP
jgi:hypothetical protein